MYPDGFKRRDKDGNELRRAFCQFVMDPIKKIFKLAMNDQKEKLFGLLGKLGVTLSTEDQELTQKKPKLNHILAEHIYIPKQKRDFPRQFDEKRFEDLHDNG